MLGGFIEKMEARRISPLPIINEVRDPHFSFTFLPSGTKWLAFINEMAGSSTAFSG